MLAGARHRIILERLQAEGSVKVSELSAIFEVTEKTVREDLEKLEEKGLLRRIHGGAVPATEGEAAVLPLPFPDTRHLREKAAIAERALALVEPGDIIALDSGSTTLEMAKRLKNEPLTVLTNDLLIIRELALKDQIRLVVPGGYRRSNVLVGSDSMDWVRRLNVHKAFISTSGIHPEYGLTIFTGELQEQKALLAASAKDVICVADHSKFDKGALLTFARLADIRCIITDAGLSDETLRKYEPAVSVIRAVPAGADEQQDH